MPKVKNTVQAQRKFAQGAVVPAQPERRAEPTAPPSAPQEPRDVQHCGMPAAQLLNLIGMRNLHPHVPVTEPVVVLERIHATNETNGFMRKLPKEKKKKKPVTQNESPKPQTTTRSLRSRVVNSTEAGKRRRRESSSTDVEDNRPLTFLSKNKQDAQKKTVPTSPPKCRVSLRQQLKNKAAQNETNRNVVKPTISTKITKAVRIRKKGRKLPPSSTAPRTRARHDATAASTSSSPRDRQVSSGPVILERSPETGETEQQPAQLERVVDSGQRSPSIQPPAHPVASTSNAGAAAAPDVYVFRDEAEEQSPFRVPRPCKPKSRAPATLQRSMSLDPTEMARETDADCIIRVLNVQTKLLSSYVKKQIENDSDKVQNISKLINIVDRYKNILQDDNQGDASTSQATPIIIIDDEESKPNMSDDYVPDIPDAPTFYPTIEEMTDLISYVEKIEPVARKYGIFKIVPPRDFQPPCQLKNVQFKCNNQYISSMYSRWNPTTSEMVAIKAHLTKHGVNFNHPPLWGGVEFDLVKLSQLMRQHGGLKNLNIADDKWTAIAEEMHMETRGGHLKSNSWLDKTYMKYVLPFDTLSEEERVRLRELVSATWQKRYNRQLKRCRRTPLQRQRRVLGESESSDEDEEPIAPNLDAALNGVEDCVVAGTNTSLTQFLRVAEHVRGMWFPDTSTVPHWAAVEHAYWRLVQKGNEHVCVHSAAIATSQETPEPSAGAPDTSQDVDAYGFPAAVDALGFPASIGAPYGNHPWNLKRLGENNHNVLSSLGQKLAVTIPTLHLGMMFSTNCWHHDPHHLPWTEFLHQGTPKIWYGIADSESGAFRAAVERLCPLAVQNKGLWLPSDTAMVPPRLLAEHGVRMVRALQAPGEYVVVLPRSYSCSISTGYTVSESLYFAGDTWLDGVAQVFAALRADAEPSMFALEDLLEGIVRNPFTNPSRLQRARSVLLPMLRDEMRRRREASALGVRALSPKELLKENPRYTKSWWQLSHIECAVCRTALHYSKLIDQTPPLSLCLEHGLQSVHKDKNEREAAPAVKTEADDPDAEVVAKPERFRIVLFYPDQDILKLISEIEQ